MNKNRAYVKITFILLGVFLTNFVLIEIVASVLNFSHLWQRALVAVVYLLLLTVTIVIVAFKILRKNRF